MLGAQQGMLVDTFINSSAGQAVVSEFFWGAAWCNKAMDHAVLPDRRLKPLPSVEEGTYSVSEEGTYTSPCLPIHRLYHSMKACSE